MKYKNYGFTLIELLAVIVILAIIALIATPIVLNIIKDSKESANLQSAEFYLGAVETAVAQKIIEDPTFKPESCEIQSDGNIKCGETLVEVEINGEVPTSGIITLDEGKITEVTLVLSEKIIVKNESGKLVYGEPSQQLYTIGQEVKFNPGDGEKTWIVIGEDNETVTLMIIENLATGLWYSTKSSDYGPKNVMDDLNRLTANWTNIDPIENYTYINNLNDTTYQDGYQKIEISNGVTTLTHKDGTITTLESTNKTKARLITLEEILEVSLKANPNLTEENLRAYIERNLGALNQLAEEEQVEEAPFETVDDVITFFEEINGWNFRIKYLNLYHSVYEMITGGEIETTYDIALPSFLCQNLQEDLYGYSGYWTLSTEDSAWVVDWDGYFGLGDNNSVELIRPVITISKSKLQN